MTRRVRTFAFTLAMLLLATHTTHAQSGTPGSVSHLRTLDRAAAALLRAGLRDSFTVQQLVRQLESSDLVVYLQVSLLDGQLAGATRLQSATPQARYAVVTIDPRATGVDLIVRLGHELRHAVEIAEAPEVRDEAGMRRLFERIGWRSGDSDRWETRAAVEIGRRVFNETWKRPVHIGDLAQLEGRPRREPQPALR